MPVLVVIGTIWVPRGSKKYKKGHFLTPRFALESHSKILNSPVTLTHVSGILIPNSLMIQLTCSTDCPWSWAKYGFLVSFSKTKKIFVTTSNDVTFFCTSQELKISLLKIYFWGLSMFIPTFIRLSISPIKITLEPDSFSLNHIFY